MHSSLKNAHPTHGYQIHGSHTPPREAVPDDERMLVARASKHDAQAFTILFNRYVNKIYTYIHHKVGSTALAEDLTSQVFLNAWASMAHYTYKHRPFRAWLFRIAHNLVVDQFRSHHETLSLEDYANSPAAGDTVESIVETKLERERLASALERLTREQEEVITLRFLAGYRIGELASIMGKDPGAVRALQYRGLLSLQGILKGNTIKV